MATSTPSYRLTLNGKDITPTIDPRLVSLSLTESRGDKADQLDITLTDHDGALALPRKGVELSLAIGWLGESLVDKGTFIVDETEHSGAPDIITIRARSADLGKDIRTRNERSYHATTLGAIVRQIAARHSLTTRIDDKLAARAISHIDQTESDIAFITRLAKRFDAVATVKRGHLLFLPINGTKTSTGATLQTITLTRASGDQHRYSTSNRDSYSGVRAYWHDPKRARRRGVLVGVSGSAKRMKESFANEAAAKAAATAEWQRLQRGAATFELALATGEPLLGPQTPVRVSGFKPEIDSDQWLCVTATHSIGDGGFTTRIECENESTAESKTSETGTVQDSDAEEN